MSSDDSEERVDFDAVNEGYLERPFRYWADLE